MTKLTEWKTDIWEMPRFKLLTATLYAVRNIRTIRVLLACNLASTQSTLQVADTAPHVTISNHSHQIQTRTE